VFGILMKILESNDLSIDHRDFKILIMISNINKVDQKRQSFMIDKNANHSDVGHYRSENFCKC
jgi:hypothetical protein